MINKQRYYRNEQNYSRNKQNAIIILIISKVKFIRYRLEMIINSGKAVSSSDRNIR